ncbi:Anaerobic nitric oxide reductase transcription regulator NorR [Enhygromyxa salina]|uniref:Anaerobic nitric oxide reductase transcription regulator NorR n=1 Tax=Enhygromyxa salina TaxID=215803 RepID=A0A0C2CS45_9BACT|nr:sigma 54-interacting transcriptional regulator [Enhygromyxa salina]KIG14001.1 Anaerobic nitric oxide reductase transcription regulator NorR [Enhygromyxa salina]
METVTVSTDRHATQTIARVREFPALVVVWSRDEPERIGEVLLPDPQLEPKSGWVFGRGPGGDERLALIRQRPGNNLVGGPLTSSRISRVQLRIRAGAADSLTIENLGRRTLEIDGRVAKRPTPVRAGAVVELRGELLLLVAQRPAELAAIDLPSELLPSFGRADAFGMVGESPPAWNLRGQIWFAAQRDVHVLVGGPSGVGKELVAQAVHALSERRGHALVSRNAATFPDGLIDAELFGNIRDYPNPGMPARAGLIGAADNSSLFLDEIGELSHELQAHLLRVLDSGEYQRLGDARAQRADLRLIAATNRRFEQLKHDLAARFRLQIEVPGLPERREDIALLVVELLRRVASNDPSAAQKLFDQGDPAHAWPAIEAATIRELLGRSYHTHVRELDGLLWTALMRSVVEGRSALQLDPRADAEPAPRPEVEPASLTTEQISAALEQAGGVQDRAWRLLGLRNRFQLMRLLKKHQLDKRVPP